MAAHANLLVVDDDASVRTMLAEYLGGHGYEVRAAADGAAMRAEIERELPDLVLLDLRLPGEDGLDLARRLREFSNVPIVILSERREEADRVMGLELAADDYITKPFSPRELLARVRAVLRRMRSADESASPAAEDIRAYRFAGFELNLRLRRLARTDGTAVPLTNSEFSLLCAFLTAPQRVLSREQLLERSRLHSLEVYDRSIDVTILRLRRKIEADPANPALLKTERGAGYLFTAAVSVLR